MILTRVLPANGVKPPAIASVSITRICGCMLIAPSRATSPSTYTILEPDLRDDHRTWGAVTYSFRRSVMDALSWSGEPAACTSSISGPEILPSSRTSTRGA